MGPHRRDAEHHRGCILTRIARVVPDIPSFDLDDGFAYTVPEEAAHVTIGSIVRVPLGGRRVRGWVVSFEEERPARVGKLRAIVTRSGDAPIFDETLLAILRWSAIHYVAPLAGMLPRAGPPNLPRGLRHTREDGRGEVLARSTRMITGSGPWHELITEVATPHVEVGGGVAVLVPTARSVEEIASLLVNTFGHRVCRATSSLPAREVTNAWQRAGQPGGILVGTSEIASWHLPLLRMAIIIEPGRRAFKAKQTPTIRATDLMSYRSEVERFSLLSLGAIPPSESIASGTIIEKPLARAWPLVEVVGRDEEGPGAAVVLERTRNAIRRIVLEEGHVFVYAPRRGYAPALRCVRCGTLRRCKRCGSGPDRGSTCRRCGAATGPCTECSNDQFQALGVGVGRIVDDLSRSFGNAVAPAGHGTNVQVGTERDLPGSGTQDLAVVINPERLWLAPNYRAEEEAIRLLARIAGTVRRGSGRRCLVQTADPQHRVITALRGGDATKLMHSIVDERINWQLPPAGSLIAVEVRGDRDAVDVDLGVITKDEADLFGPAPAGDAWRWLIQGPESDRIRIRLRGVVQGWRDRGYAVRIDADPIDL